MLVDRLCVLGQQRHMLAGRGLHQEVARCAVGEILGRDAQHTRSVLAGELGRSVARSRVADEQLMRDGRLHPGGGRIGGMQEWRMTFFGVLLVIIMIVRPWGLIGVRR